MPFTGEFSGYPRAKGVVNRAVVRSTYEASALAARTGIGDYSAGRRRHGYNVSQCR